MAENKKKYSKGYSIMWLAFTAVYAVWMCFFMKADTYPAADTGMTDPIFYPLWVAGSCIIMLSYIYFLNRYLYGSVSKGTKLFALVSLIFGCVFITWYGFFKNPFEYTASMIGLDYPWHFKMWGIFAPISIFVNTLYMYRKYDYSNKAGIISGSIGCAAMFVTINVPSAGEELILNSLRCMSHWTGALVFAFGCAVPVIMFLVHMAKTRDKRFIVSTVVFSAILLTMLILLATVGKNGIIESLPMWAVYILMFLINFTKLFELKKTEEKQPALV